MHGAEGERSGGPPRVAVFGSGSGAEADLERARRLGAAFHSFPGVGHADLMQHGPALERMRQGL